MPIDLASLNANFAATAKRRAAAAGSSNGNDLARPDASPRPNFEPSRQDTQRRSANAGNASGADRGNRDAAPAPRAPSHDGADKRSSPADFRKNLEQGAQPQTGASNNDKVPVAGPLIAVGAQQTVAGEGGELALSLLLPAALGEGAVEQLVLDVAEQGLDPQLAATLAPLLAHGLAQRPQALTGAQQVVSDLVPEVDLLAPQNGEQNPLLAADQEVAIIVKVAGEEVPVTLQILAPQISEDPAQQQQLAAQVGQQTVLAEMTMQPLVADEQAQVAPLLVAANGQEPGKASLPGQGVQPEVALQAALQGKGMGVQTLKAPAAVAENAPAALQLQADGELPHVSQPNASSSAGQLSIESLRPTAEAPAPAAPATQAKGEAADKAVQQQVSRAVVQQMANGDRTLVLRLTPPQLGTVRIELVESRGQITVRFHAEDDSVRKALERQLPQLRQDLRAADAPVASVRLEDNTSAWQQGQHQQRQQFGQSPERRNGGPAFSIEGGMVEEEAPPASVARPTLGGKTTDELVDARA